jgi:exodeoxyribonuclease-5
MVRREKDYGDDPVAGDRLVALQNDHASKVWNGSLWTIRKAEPYRDEAEVVLPKGRVQIVKRDLVRLELEDDLGTVITASAHDDCFHVKVDPRDNEYEGLGCFDYGYALTCHKAQGSEWAKVVVIDETNSFGFRKIIGDLDFEEFRQRWLYTAVTRAKADVVIMEPPR